MNNETNGRSLSGVVAEIKEELKDFIDTRVRMLRSEMRDKIKAWKVAVPLMAVGLVIAATAWFLLSAALVALIAVAFLPNPFAYAISFAIVGAFYLLIGVMFALFGYREVAEKGMTPERTIKVLKQDQAWIATEARSQL